MQLLASVCPHSCSAWHLHTSTEFPYNSIVCFTSCLTIHVSFFAVVTGVQGYSGGTGLGVYAFLETWPTCMAAMNLGLCQNGGEEPSYMLQKLLESVDSFYEARDRDGKLVSGTDVM